ADVEKLSMRATMKQFARMEDNDGSLFAATRRRKREGGLSGGEGTSGARYGRFRAPRDGMQTWIDRLADHVRPRSMQLNSRIGSVVKTDRGWKLNANDEYYDAVVFATPPHVSARLCQDFAPEVGAELAGIESASTAIIVMGIQKDKIAKNIDTFGLVVPPMENRQVLACSFASHKFPNRAPDDAVLLRAFLGGATQPQVLDSTDEQLVDIACRDLRDIIGLQSEPEMVRVFRWNEAMPQYHVGHLERTAKIESMVSDHPGLKLAGNGLHGVGLAVVVKNAAAIAAELLGSEV
ncbi:MAG: protoporphyrinogen oxidase, partial [Planctomycetota bacterium]